jgi:hypothetical protein
MCMLRRALLDEAVKPQWVTRVQRMQSRRIARMWKACRMYSCDLETGVGRLSGKKLYIVQRWSVGALTCMRLTVHENRCENAECVNL